MDGNGSLGRLLDCEGSPGEDSFDVRPERCEDAGSRSFDPELDGDAGSDMGSCVNSCVGPDVGSGVDVEGDSFDGALGDALRIPRASLERVLPMVSEVP